MTTENNNKMSNIDSLVRSKGGALVPELSDVSALDASKKDKSFQLSLNKNILEVDTDTLIKHVTKGLKLHNFTDTDAVHLYICREHHQMMIQNIEKKFDLFEEKKMKIGKFTMKNIYSTSEDGQKAFFESAIITKIKELRAALTEDANS